MMAEAHSSAEAVLTQYFNGPSWRTMSQTQIDDAIRHLAGKGEHETKE